MDREKLYDEQIAPLLALVRDVCRAHNIPFLALAEPVCEEGERHHYLTVTASVHAGPEVRRVMAVAVAECGPERLRQAAIQAMEEELRAEAGVGVLS